MRWLIDEMLPPATATELTTLGHDAVGVAEIGLAGSDDVTVYQTAVDQQRVVVTENFADFATIIKDRRAGDEPATPVVFVRKDRHPRGSALAPALARHLHQWATENPRPYPGVHWP